MPVSSSIHFFIPWEEDPRFSRLMSRHRAACHRHPAEGAAMAFCHSCLSERLAAVDSSSSSAANRHVTLDHRQFHRSRSSAGVSNRDVVNELRRKSCDSRPRGGAVVGTFSSRRDGRNEMRFGAGEIRNRERRTEESESNAVDCVGAVELRTMREFIDLELHSNGKKQTKKEHLSFRNLGDKLRKWRGKGKTKTARNLEGSIDAKECGVGRKSCDMEPARASVDYPRDSINSFEEPRVSLDGYLLGRTYRLTPLVSVLEDAKIIQGSLDCCEKKKGSSLDLKASKPVAKPRVSLDSAEMFYGSKLVITERELMAWNTKSKGGARHAM